MKAALAPMHPGELFREEVLPALGRTKSEIAALLGISRETLYGLLQERQAVTLAMALRLGKLVGNGPELWINLQTHHDLARLDDAMATELAEIPTLPAADGN